MKRNTSLTQLFRNGISMLCGILLLSASLSSCLDEPLFETPGRSDQGVKMYIRIPAPSISQTRAGSAIDDKYVDPSSVYVFVLSGTQDDSNVLQVVNAVAGTGDTYYAKLKESSTARYVYVVANAKDIIEGIGIKDLSEMTLSQLKSQLSKTVKADNGVISEPISLQPMFGEWKLTENGITPETTIGTPDNQVKLFRITSKITITEDVEEINFTLLGANLVNAPQVGYIVPGQAATDKRLPTGVDGDIDKMISTPTEGNETATVLYSFESANGTDNPTFVIIQATYSGSTYYYRLNLNNKETDYPLLRNYHYMVIITKVNKAGYETAQKAIDNPAGNIEYVISVVDETGQNMISNGKYYMAVSQTEFYYITEEGEPFGDQVVTTVTHNAPEGTTRSCVASEGIEVTSGFPDDPDKSFQLKVTMNEGTTEGTVKLTLGDLTREIKVYHKTVKNIHFGSTFNFSNKSYIAGKIADTKNESFIKLAEKEDASDKELFSSLESQEEKIYVRLEGYFGADEEAIREPAVDLFRRDALGNARVVFKQKMHNIYEEIVGQAKVAPYTYVGTFHRWNETGERIIRIHAKNVGSNANEKFHWKAFIVSGDFIRLSEQGSAEGEEAIHFDRPYGDGDNTQWGTAEIEEHGQLKEQELRTSLDVKGPISFRVGLTSKLANETSKPRYGLIAVVVNPKTKDPITRYIYVRQGEEADYLMRPEDKMNTELSHGSGRRELAEKYLPYNLTDPRGNEFLTQPHVGDPTGFVKFPSQAGYLYEAMYTQKIDNGIYWITSYDKGRGWLANGELGESTTHHAFGNEWKKDYEICPAGYRHPKGHTSKNTVKKEDITVGKSPIRQSLWLYPKNEMLSETQNFIIGYIADGYYDRREMKGQVSFDKGTSYQPTYVGDGAAIAYIGVLAFNPYNSASLFIPFTGFRNYNGYYHRGMNSYIWTSGMQTLSTFWTAAFGILEIPGTTGTDKFRADNYSGTQADAFSVRCVKGDK